MYCLKIKTSDVGQIEAICKDMEEVKEIIGRFCGGCRVTRLTVDEVDIRL